ncbi:MAG: GNAT family N-acetyltransferase [Chloroflexota bacterium]|nr:GNAT family N-acetyltransferase [Chloroflexota bacterium]
MLQLETAEAGRVALARLERTDGEALRRLFYRLSPETIYRRFLSPIARPDQARPERLLDLDDGDREAVAAVLGGEIVGVARYFRLAGGCTAEIAVVVADDWQRQGLATRMLARLADLARAAGIEHFAITMQADNRPAVRLLRRLDSGARLVHSQGIYETSVPLGQRRTEQ